MTEAFHGAKVAILVGDRIVTILRDDKPGLSWAGFWDLPGGGREGGESAVDCVVRETREELGLTLDPARIVWRRDYPSEGSKVCFFVLEMPDFRTEDVVFGDEGQGWKLAPVAWFLEEERAVPMLKERLFTYFSEKADVAS